MRIKEELLTQEEINGLLHDSRGDDMSAAKEDEYKDMIIEGDFKKALKEYMLHNYIGNTDLLDINLIEQISKLIGLEAKIILNNILIDSIQETLKKPF